MLKQQNVRTHDPSMGAWDPSRWEARGRVLVLKSTDKATTTPAPSGHAISGQRLNEIHRDFYERQQ
jgi:hypothetical protein